MKNANLMYSTNDIAKAVLKKIEKEQTISYNLLDAISGEIQKQRKLGIQLTVSISVQKLGKYN